MAATEFHAQQIKQVINTNNGFIQKLITAYKRIYARVSPRIQNIVLKLQAQPTITVKQIATSAELVALITAVSDELEDYTGYVKVELDLANQAALFLALTHVSQLYKEYGHQNVKVLPLEALDFLNEWMKPGSPLLNRLSFMPETVQEAMRNVILEGVRLGRNPLQIARLLTNQFGMGFTDSARMMRTLQLYSYREATRANWIAGGIVEGWIWYATLDDRTCMSCVNMHGTIHTLDENLNDHHNGRCAMLSYPFGLDALNMGDPNGLDWFNKQSEAQQVEMMGKAKWEAWKGNQFDFSKLTKTYENDVFGTMRSEASLKDLLNG